MSTFGQPATCDCLNELTNCDAFGGTAVCGEDKKSYVNSCHAAKAGITKFTEGECRIEMKTTKTSEAVSTPLAIFSALGAITFGILAI